jgi:adenylate kinase
MRTQPNIIITGTPGVGKSSHCEQLAASTGLKHLSISALATERNCITGRDMQLNTSIVDEDLLLDALETMEVPIEGGYLIDWHACDLFPEAWIDLVVVLRAGTETLYDRLVGRGSAANKVEENIDAEVMQVILEEARGAFEEEVLVELRSDGVEDLDANVKRIELWVEQWRKDNNEQEGGR